MICSLAYVLELVVFHRENYPYVFGRPICYLVEPDQHTWVSSGSFQIILYLPNSSLLSNRFTWMNRHLVTDIQHTDRWLADDTWPVWATLHHLVSIRARSWLGFRPRGCLMSTRTHVLSRGVPWQQSRQSRGFSLTARGRHDVKQVKRKPFDCTVPRAISRRERVGTLSWRAAGWANDHLNSMNRKRSHCDGVSVTGSCRNANVQSRQRRKCDKKWRPFPLNACCLQQVMLIQNFRGTERSENLVGCDSLTFQSFLNSPYHWWVLTLYTYTMGGVCMSTWCPIWK